MADRHAFTITTAAGEECQHCGVTVEEEHLIEGLTIPCPAGGCTDPANRGEACVFVQADTKGNVECSYCERPGDPSGSYDGDEAGLDWFYGLDDEDDEDDLEPAPEEW